MLGTYVKDKYLVIEFLPFSTYPDERPGLIIENDLHSEEFTFFQTKCNQLWDFSTKHS
jgi:hypothetical protein